MCLFIFQLSLVLTAPTYRGMARLSFMTWELITQQEDLSICRQSPIHERTRPTITLLKSKTNALPSSKTTIICSHKILYFLGSRSCKVIDVDTINKHITIACYDNLAYRHRDLTNISNKSRVIAHSIPDFVAMATRERGRWKRETGKHGTG